MGNLWAMSNHQINFDLDVIIYKIFKKRHSGLC